MKKLILLSIILIVGCDYAPTEHTHDGICARRLIGMTDGLTNKYTCYNHSAYTEKACLSKQAYIINEDDISYSWFYMTCEEFCDLQSEISCEINSEAP